MAREILGSGCFRVLMSSVLVVVVVVFVDWYYFLVVLWSPMAAILGNCGPLGSWSLSHVMQGVDSAMS